MSLNFSNPSHERQLPPEGITTGRIYSVIDHGVQKIEFKGDIKHQPKISLGFELLNRPMSDGRPFVVSGSWTVSLNPKAKLLGVLKNIFGPRFKVIQMAGKDTAYLGTEEFKAEDLLGVYCKVTVVHTVGRDGTEWANIQSVSQMPEPEPGDPPVKLPPPVNPNVFFDLEKPDWAVFDTLHKYHQDKIRASKEWKKLHPEEGKATPTEEEDPYAGMPSPEVDIPF